MYESNCCVNSYRQQEETKHDARVTGEALGPLANRDSPIDHKQPNAIRQMPNRRDNADQINNEDYWIDEFALYNRERRVRMSRN